MEKEVYYSVYGIKRDGTRQLIGSYQDSLDAHDAAMRYTAMFQTMQIEKSSNQNFRGTNSNNYLN